MINMNKLITVVENAMPIFGQRKELRMSSDQGDPHAWTKPNQDLKELAPELAALRDNLVRYEIASAEERQRRDALIATWRDLLHAYLKEIGYGDPRLVHAVLDSMDEFLNRAGGRRK
jgi:hypothetical protein